MSRDQRERSIAPTVRAGASTVPGGSGAVVHRELEVLSAAFPHAHARVSAVIAQHIEIDIEACHPLLVVIEIARDALQCVQPRFFRRHPVAHIFNNRVRTRNPNVLFAAPG